MKETIERECPVCRSRYFASAVRLGFGRQTTCSRKCSYELRAAPKRARSETECATCRKPITTVPSKTALRKHGAAFCSRECHYAGRAIGATKRVVSDAYEISPETRASQSRRAAVAYSRGETLPIPKTEHGVAAALMAEGVDFVHQCVFEHERGAICVDFFFPDRRLVVEIDGDHHKKPLGSVSDVDRDAWLSRVGVRVVRVPNADAIAATLAAVRVAA